MTSTPLLRHSVGITRTLGCHRELFKTVVVGTFFRHQSACVLFCDAVEALAASKVFINNAMTATQKASIWPELSEMPAVLMSALAHC